MGFFSKLLGRDDDESPVESPVVSNDQVRQAVNELSSAIEDLLKGMDTDDAPRGNPAWEGRRGDLRIMTRDLHLLVARPQFTKDELFEVLTTVRPLYKTKAQAEFAHLEVQNSRVVVAIDRVRESV